MEKTRNHSALKPRRAKTTHSIQHLLQKKETEAVAEQIVKNPELLRELEDGIHSTNPEIKFGSAKALRTLSERNPEMLYSEWRFFVNLLGSENNIVKWNAMDIIANLTKVDSRNKFNRLFKKFYGLLHEGSLITAGHVVDNSARIVLSKPQLQDEIIRELLKVEKIPLPTEECRNILVGKTINAFQGYYDKIKAKDKAEAVAFAKRHLNNSRNATRSKAEKFLKKLEKQR